MSLIDRQPIFFWYSNYLVPITLYVEVEMCPQEDLVVVRQKPSFL
jgi:hypothetical protein